MITITRKIQLNFVADSKDEVKALFQKLYGWQRICHRAANWISTHQYIQEHLKDFFYLTEEVKVKLADHNKSEDGILNTSAVNTTYQLLSKHFKGECPTGMLSGLNTVVSQTYKKEAGDVKWGKKSLRSYRNTIPMPVRRADISRINKGEDGNYTFFVYRVSFKTYFGKDLSGNEQIMDAAMAGTYKWCDSSIQLDGNKMFLLAVFQFEKQEVELDAEKTCEAELDVNTPIKLTIGRRELTIGTAEEFLHRRTSIQQALKRAQIGSRYNSGGKGREKKMQAIERFKKAEDNYVDTRIHQYTSKLVDLCVKNKCGKLVLKNQSEKEAEAKLDEEFLLRNWTYFGMKEKLSYKCRKFGIELIVE
jgi:IS605 OrfB family transposase